jgi:hypothetical protein
MQIGQRPNYFRRPTVHRRRHEDKLAILLEHLQEEGFEDSLEYGAAHARLKAPLRFLAAMKNEATAANWYSSEADVNLKIQKRAVRTTHGMSPFRVFDSGTMMSIQYPSRVLEEVWCRRQSNPQDEECRGHGYDPQIPNARVSEHLEVKVSQVGDRAGRGVFAKKFIPKGSYIGLEEAVGMYVPPATYDLLWRLYDALRLEYWETLAFGYLDGYGWSTNELVSMDCGWTSSIVRLSHVFYRRGLHPPQLTLASYPLSTMVVTGLTISVWGINATRER